MVLEIAGSVATGIAVIFAVDAMVRLELIRRHYNIVPKADPKKDIMKVKTDGDDEALMLRDEELRNEEIARWYEMRAKEARDAAAEHEHKAAAIRTGKYWEKK
jgi:hypothetical protein